MYPLRTRRQFSALAFVFAIGWSSLAESFRPTSGCNIDPETVALLLRSRPLAWDLSCITCLAHRYQHSYAHFPPAYASSSVYQIMPVAQEASRFHKVVVGKAHTYSCCLRCQSECLAEPLCFSTQLSLQVTSSAV
ncbi:hypothetical protein BDN71DRAFT_317229 [Pleurotus eryngii]|uniref:Secreted protein n=1 Tax=Pleurotus eryngii TaxID=5323 RepID=A0A9P6D3B6_PLEER|nr:hypothetical protein BDN71DRAFT_317229 [Pleurotus eryngii]